MTFIILNEVGLSIPVPLFQNLTLTINQNDRLGIIAGNGGGKSSLLGCIAGRRAPSTGKITRSRGLVVGFVEQLVPADLLDLTLLEAVRMALPAHERDNNLWRVDILLDELEAPVEMRGQPLRTLSGGWQRLALIARAWAAEPNVLLLDEPTNHLDLEKIQVLERWMISKSKGTPMIIASHDRRFLDTCTTRSLFLRPDISKMFDHPYSQARALLAEDDAAQAAKLSRNIKEVERLRQSAGELRNIGVNSRSDAAQKKSKQIAQRAAAIEERLTPLFTERFGTIRLRSRPTHAKVLLSIDDYCVQKPDGVFLFRTGKLNILQGDRIVLLGPNGAGKSRFVGLLRRAFCEATPLPSIRYSPSVVLGFADQHMSQLPNNETLFDYITGSFQLGDQRSRTLLAGAGFPVEQQMRLIKHFSAGQKARLGMLALRLIEPNFYLLDEPTNHVDIAGQEKLESEILAQEATSLFVSHDRRFVENIGTRFFLIEKQKLREIGPTALVR